MSSIATSRHNKSLIEGVHAELAKGNGQPFVDLLSEDATWTIQGRTAWSRRYVGKAAIRDELLTPLFAQFDGRYRSTAQHVMAEDDRVVVQCQGQVATRRGLRYDNQYCYIYRLEGGRVVELTEYLDTALVDAVLAPPEKKTSADVR
jgi:ketosteroid isomerase-like protein